MAEIKNKFEDFLDGDINYLNRIYKSPEELKDAELLFFYLYDGGYDESMMVVFRKDGKLYEHSDSHCSCYGFEDWGAEETSIEALEKRSSYDNAFEKRLKAFVIFLKLEKQEAEHG